MMLGEDDSAQKTPAACLAWLPLMMQDRIVGEEEYRQLIPPPRSSSEPRLIVIPCSTEAPASPWSKRNPRPAPRQSMTQPSGSPLCDRTTIALPKKLMFRFPSPVYVPFDSAIVSPSATASIAAWIVGKSPAPSGVMT